MITKSILTTGVWVPSLAFSCQTHFISLPSLLSDKRNGSESYSIFLIYRERKIYSALKERTVWSKFPIKYSRGVRRRGTDTKQKSHLISSCLSSLFLLHDLTFIIPFCLMCREWGYFIFLFLPQDSCCVFKTRKKWGLKKNVSLSPQNILVVKTLFSRNRKEERQREHFLVRRGFKVRFSSSSFPSYSLGNTWNFGEEE